MEKMNVQTAGSAEMVTISRTEYEKLTAALSQKTQELNAAYLQNDWHLEQLKLSKKKLFGKSSEQAEEAVLDQLSFVFNEA